MKEKMQIGVWDEAYSVNNDIIDEQHKGLLSILSRMDRLVSEHGNPEVMVGLLTEMNEYAIEHFRSEEQYMQHIGYPELEKHMELHSSYTMAALKFTLGHLVDSPDNPKVVLNFLRQWWTDHILGADKDYALHALRSRTS